MCGINENHFLYPIYQCVKAFYDLWSKFFCLLIYQVAVFLAWLSLSIGIVTLLSLLNEICFGSPFSPTFSSILTFVILAFWGESHIILQSNTAFGQDMRRNKLRHPFVLNILPSTIYVILYFIALSQLCVQYLAINGVHLLEVKGFRGANRQQHLNPDHAHVHHIAGEAEANHRARHRHTSNTTETCFIEVIFQAINDPVFKFLLSVAYMTYLIARVNEWTVYRCNHFNLLLHTKFGSCWTFFTFYLVQMALLALYLCPVLIVCFLCRFVVIPLELTFILVCMVCVSVGTQAISWEAKAPFPDLPQRSPEYFFENHIAARSFMATYTLYPMIVIPFFATNNNDYHKSPSSEHEMRLLNNAETRFYLYTLIVGLTFLQSLKIVLNVCYSRPLIYYDPALAAAAAAAALEDDMEAQAAAVGNNNNAGGGEHENDDADNEYELLLEQVHVRRIMPRRGDPEFALRRGNTGSRSGSVGFTTTGEKIKKVPLRRYVSAQDITFVSQSVQSKEVSESPIQLSESVTQLENGVEEEEGEIKDNDDFTRINVKQILVEEYSAAKSSESDAKMKNSSTFNNNDNNTATVGQLEENDLPSCEVNVSSEGPATAATTTEMADPKCAKEKCSEEEEKKVKPP